MLHEGMLLEPGEYLIEMGFYRPVSREVLLRALGHMGFDHIVLDEGSTNIGLSVMRGAERAAAVQQIMTTKAMGRAKPPPAAAAPRPSNMFSASASMAPASKPAAPVMQASASMAPPKPAAPPASPMLSASAQMAPAPTSMFASAVKTPIATAPSKAPSGAPSGTPSGAPSSMPSGMPTGMPTGPSGPMSMPSGETGEPTASSFRAPAPEAAEMEMAPAAPEAPLAAPEAAPSLTAERVKSLWTKWRNWGSPFATSPRTIDNEAMASMQVSGEGGFVSTVRFIARLSAALETHEPEWMKWLFVRKLHIHPYQDLELKVRPWVLEPRKYYEFRLLSRDKTAATREQVRQKLGEMGFAPMKLSLIRRNIRLPRRPTSLTLWFGVGQWLKPKSVINVEDPFYFEEMKEIQS